MKLEIKSYGNNAKGFRNPNLQIFSYGIVNSKTQRRECSLIVLVQ
jgi:hypothetical protein